MIRKPYDPLLAEEYQGAKKVVMKYVKKHSISATHHEIEARDWVGRWPYNTVHVLERRVENALKVCRLYEVLFWAVSKDFTQGWLIPGRNIRDVFYKPNPNKLQKGEMIYDIPLNLCERIDFIEKPKQPRQPTLF